VVLLGVASVVLLTMFAATVPRDRLAVEDGFRAAVAVLQGEAAYGDFAQDYVGARALRDDERAYPVLGPAFARVGIDWPVEHRSTHPPTAFLFALPFVGLDWATASAAWAALMLVALASSAWLLGLRWPLAILAAVAMLAWPPAAASLSQMTPIWLLGASFAWRFRARPGLAGAAIGAAALTKVFPLLLLAPFVLRGRVRAVLAAAAVCVGGVAAVALLSPSALADYATLGREASRLQLDRLDNSSLLVFSSNVYGLGGVICVAALIAALAAVSVRADRRTSFDFASWSRWSWLSVALLPIAWIYSLLPLLPVFVYLLGRRPAFAVVIPTMLALASSALVQEPGLPGALPIAAAQLLLGIALLVHALTSTSESVSAAVSPRPDRPLPRLLRREVPSAGTEGV
jgi:hypothetical protein